MKANEKLNSIMTLLGIPTPKPEKVKVKMETMKLENGTDIEADSFEKDKEVFILTDDERVAMPVGEYILEDSRLLVVEQEGIIADVRDVSDDVPQKEEITEDLAEDDGKEADVRDWDGMEKRMQNLEDAVADLKADKVESKEDKPEDENAELKAELSQPAAQAIKHSPEAVTAKTESIPFSKHRTKSIMDSVLLKILNN